MAYFTLHVLSGKQIDKRIPIDLPTFLIGRAEQCHLRPADQRVSREHCLLLTDERGVLVRDLNSANGTFVNGEQVTGTRRLLPGDRLRIVELEFGIEFDIADREAMVAAVATPGPWQAALVLLTYVLQSRHAHYAQPNAEFLAQLFDALSDVRRQLAGNFSQVIVVDVGQCLDGGRLDFQLLLRRLRDEMFAAFQLQTDASTFHEQQIVQVLKDEDPSLFCFVNVQHFVEGDVQRLREFTQSKHRVLFCGPHDYISSRSRPADGRDFLSSARLPDGRLDDSDDDGLAKWLAFEDDNVREYATDESWSFDDDLGTQVMPAAPREPPPRPRKLPPQPPGDTRDAAAEVLKRLFQRRGDPPPPEQPPNDDRPAP
jgi:hypothetical protein